LPYYWYIISDFTGDEMGLQSFLKYLPFRPAEAEFEPILLKDIVRVENIRKTPPLKKPINNYRDKIVELFDFHNLPAEYYNALLKNLDKANFANVNSALETIIIRSFKCEPLKFTQPKPLMVVGMPGIGKTASIAKMATEAKYYDRKVNVITTDIKRAGGVEQLKNFCRILGVEMQLARNPKQLAKALEGKEDQITLIDSAGANPYVESDIELLGELLKVADIEPIFVLQAGGDPDDAVDMGQNLKKLGINRMIVTKIDSARRIGGMLATALENDLTFANFSSTSSIGKGLDPYTPKALVSQLFKAFVVEEKEEPAEPKIKT
jgi:flagellar biosynthesis protein FlhF